LAETRIGLVSCSKAKIDRRAAARDLYSASDLFRKAARYCAAHCDDWYILSAKYGLVRPDEVLEPYDLTLKRMRVDERRRWGLAVASKLRELGAVKLEIHAGQYYVQPLVDAGIALENPLAGLGLGQRKRWYAQQLAVMDANR